MKVILGEEGLKNTWQEDFPEETKCCHCKGEARIAFVADEIVPHDYQNTGELVHYLHENKGKGDYWLHDSCAVAVYFCRDCLEPTALYNQA